MKLAVLAVLVAGGCSSATHPAAPAPTPEAITECYAGLSTGMGQRARTIARRTVDPAARQIVEDVSHDDAGAHGAKSFHVVMSVDGDHFTMTEAGGAFTGTGTLTGEPWQWTSWTSVAQLPNTPITVESHDERTPDGLKATKQIKKSGELIATTTDELAAFDCARWDEAKAALAAPATVDTPATVDRPACERACRNFATLRFWQKADPEIARLPAADQAAAREREQQAFTTKLEAGLETCITTCLDAKNPAQTACWGHATTADQLNACDAT